MQLYYYRIGADAALYNFTSGASRPGGKMYLVLADLGVVNDVALAPMIEATAAGDFDAVLHSGDCEARGKTRRTYEVALLGTPVLLIPPAAAVHPFHRSSSCFCSSFSPPHWQSHTTSRTTVARTETRI